MAAGTKKRKKRMKRQLQKRFKQTSGIVIAETKESPKELYQKALDRVYGGAVRPLNAYLNERAVLLFHCDKCGTEFYNRASHMVGRYSQRHVCTMPYGDWCGNRFSQTYNRGGTGRKKTGKKKHEVNVAERLTAMIEQDYTYSQIAKELGVNPGLIKYHFQKEGLI